MKEKGYALGDYLSRNCNLLGPKIEAKLNFFAGEIDNFYLNIVVYLSENFLGQTFSPYYLGFLPSAGQKGT